MHDLLPSHLSSSQEAVGAGGPSISVLVLYLNSICSLSIDVSSWGSTLLLMLLRRLETTPVHRFPYLFLRALLIEDNVLVHSCSFSELCLRSVADPKLTEASDRLCTDLDVH